MRKGKRTNDVRSDRFIIWPTSKHQKSFNAFFSLFLRGGKSDDGDDDNNNHHHHCQAPNNKMREGVKIVLRKFSAIPN